MSSNRNKDRQLTTAERLCRRIDLGERALAATIDDQEADGVRQVLLMEVATARTWLAALTTANHCRSTMVH